MSYLVSAGGYFVSLSAANGVCTKMLTRGFKPGGRWGVSQREWEGYYFHLRLMSSIHRLCFDITGNTRRERAWNFREGISISKAEMDWPSTRKGRGAGAGGGLPGVVEGGHVHLRLTLRVI